MGVATSGPAAYIIGSYLLIPTLAPDGTLLPLLPVGWTLSFEMAFYAMVAIAIVLQRRPFAGLLLTLALLASSRPFLSHVELLVFFGLGVLLACSSPFLQRVWFWPSLAMLLASLCALAAVRLSVFGLGLAATLCLAGALAVDRRIGKYLPYPLILLGDSSYSLYLCHWLLLKPSAVLAHRASLGRLQDAVLYAAFCLAASVGAFLLVERPVMEWFRHRRLTVRTISTGVQA